MGYFYENGGTLADAENIYYEDWSNAHITCYHECEYCYTNLNPLPYPLDQCDYWMGDSHLGGFMYFDYFALYDAHPTLGHEFYRKKADTPSSPNLFAISYFPNPVSSILTVSISDELVDRDVVICLFDVLGRNVFSKKLNGIKCNFNFSEIGNGLYSALLYVDHEMKNKTTLMITK